MQLPAGLRQSLKMNKMNKKSQITWFIIIGIVVIFIAGAFFYYARTILTNLPNMEVRGVEPVNDYIINCIDQTATRAIELVGKQGGYIFERQGGLVKDFSDAYKGKFFIPYTDQNGVTYEVAYGISKRERDYMIYKADTPGYPWEGFPGVPPNYKGLFGDSELPVLYKKDGPFSIQAEIESYINKKLVECLDFSVLEGYEIIAPAEFKTDVKIAKNDVVISVNYPVQIKTATETRNLDEFNVKKNIRLKAVYDFTKDLINLDNTDISFDIKKSSEGISSNKKEDVYVHDDIIIIKDKTYEFWFARQNRPPAHNPSGEHQDPDEDTLTTQADETGVVVCVNDGQYSDCVPTYSN